MHYSAVAFLAIIVNFILNRKIIGNLRFRENDSSAQERVNIRYAHFLWATNLYYLVDIAWGFLYQRHDVPGLFPLLYSDTVFYFIFMLLTLLTWARYIVAYLNKSGRRSRALVYGMWFVFILGLI